MNRELQQQKTLFKITCVTEHKEDHTLTSEKVIHVVTFSIAAASEIAKYNGYEDITGIEVVGGCLLPE